MHPELFHLPFTSLTVKSYGLMMVIGFIAAVSIIRRLSKNMTPDPQYITNAALYSLIAGVVGARIFYVIHHFDQFQGRLSAMFAIWQGGLELLGGVVLSITVIFIFLRYHKLPVRRYLDTLAIGLLVALAFGRIGCFLNGCCFGKPANLPWAVRFPYASLSYQSQVQPDLKRNRIKAYFELPDDFFTANDKGEMFLRPYNELTDDQKQFLKDTDKLRSLPVHPTELYSSANALLLCLILYLVRRRPQKENKILPGLFAKPGCTFGLMFILYGITRFLIECVRDDNPFEHGWWALYQGGTISQNLVIYLVIFGVALVILFQKMPPDTFRPDSITNRKHRR